MAVCAYLTLVTNAYVRRSHTAIAYTARTLPSPDCQRAGVHKGAAVRSGIGHLFRNTCGCAVGSDGSSALNRREVVASTLTNLPVEIPTYVNPAFQKFVGQAPPVV